MLRSDTTTLFERLREANILLQEVLSGAHENMSSLEHTMVTRVSEFVSTMNELTERSGTAGNQVEEHIGKFHNVTTRVLGDLAELAGQFETHGRGLAEAVALIDRSNRRTEDTLSERRVALDSVLSTLDIRTDDLEQRLKRFSGLLDESLDAAANRARDIARVVSDASIGGAQAVAALAYGTATIRRVDKIVGPGNVYVALAKRRVFGEVGIDMVAGPSEVVVVADGAADPEWIAADLLAQAEHDPMARAVLVTDAEALVPRVEQALARQLRALPRRAIAGEALARHGALVVVGGLEDAVELANRLAPEHLELLVRVPLPLLPRVRHAGAVFVGGGTPEVVGDYVAGPSHVLPTAGTARFSSPLGIEDFVKRSSVIEYSVRGLAAARTHLAALTEVEGLAGHGRAAEVRLHTTDGGEDA